jgi:hypothetical protein
MHLPMRFISIHESDADMKTSSRKNTPSAPSDHEAAKTIIHSLRNGSSEDRSQPEDTLILGTDPAADIDDECSFIVGQELDKLGVSNLLLIVSNRDYKQRGAKSIKNILKDMGASKIPVACGTNDLKMAELKLEHYYKVDTDEPDKNIPNGEMATVRALEGLKKKGRRCRIVVISSFRDLSLLLKNHEKLVRETVSAVYFQAHWYKDPDNQQLKPLIPDKNITNYNWDIDSAVHVLEWFRQENIPTFTATRDAAIKAAVPSRTLKDAVAKGHPVAEFIYRRWIDFEKKCFAQASEKDPKKRFHPLKDLRWYVGRHLRWAKAKGTIVLPKSFDEIEEYLDLVLYDAVAVLACMLKDSACFNKLFQPHQQTLRAKGKDVHHYIIGRSIEEPDINAELLSELMSQLIQKAFTGTSG